MMTLHELKDDFLRQPVTEFRPIEVRNSGNRMSMILYRQPPFQIELVIWSAGLVMQAHCHPNLDSLGVHVSGDAVFIRGDSEQKVNDFLGRAKIWPASKVHNYQNLRAHPGEWHGGKAGKNGAIFYSFQKWCGAEITCAGQNYVGPKLPTPELWNFR